jgi:hypothetical protein
LTQIWLRTELIRPLASVTVTTTGAKLPGVQPLVSTRTVGLTPLS